MPQPESSFVFLCLGIISYIALLVIVVLKFSPLILLRVRKKKFDSAETKFADRLKSFSGRIILGSSAHPEKILIRLERNNNIASGLYFVIAAILCLRFIGGSTWSNIIIMLLLILINSIEKYTYKKTEKLVYCCEQAHSNNFRHTERQGNFFDTLYEQNISLKNLFENFKKQNTRLRICLDTFYSNVRPLRVSALQVRKVLQSSYRKSYFVGNIDVLRQNIQKLHAHLEAHNENFLNDLRVSADTAGIIEQSSKDFEHVGNAFENFSAVWQSFDTARIIQHQRHLSDLMYQLSNQFINEISYLTGTISSKIVEPYISASQFFEHKISNNAVMFQQAQNEIQDYLKKLEQHHNDAVDFTARLAAVEESVHKISSANINLAAIVLESLKLLKSSEAGQLYLNYNYRPLNQEIRELHNIVQKTLKKR